jgi:hypothetical protein
MEKIMERVPAETKTSQEMLAKMEAKTDASLKEMKEEIKAKEEEIIAPEDRSWKQRPAVGYRNSLKGQTMNDVVREALKVGRSRRGAECSNNSIRDRGLRRDLI